MFRYRSLWLNVLEFSHSVSFGRFSWDLMESFTHLCLSYCKLMKMNSWGKFCGGRGSKQIFAKSEDTAFVTPPFFFGLWTNFIFVNCVRFQGWKLEKNKIKAKITTSEHLPLWCFSIITKTFILVLTKDNNSLPFFSPWKHNAGTRAIIRLKLLGATFIE